MPAPARQLCPQAQPVRSHVALAYHSWIATLLLRCVRQVEFDVDGSTALKGRRRRSVKVSVDNWRRGVEKCLANGRQKKGGGEPKGVSVGTSAQNEWQSYTVWQMGGLFVGYSEFVPWAQRHVERG